MQIAIFGEKNGNKIFIKIFLGFQIAIGGHVEYNISGS
jgi:hypothetical protein